MIDKAGQASGNSLIYRHELKYFVSYGEYMLIRERLRHILKCDPYAGKNGAYHIRSLYFDDHTDTALKTKLSGDDEREKVRIRIYNLSDSVIKLESKRKNGPYISKTSLRITREQADLLAAGDARALRGMDSPLAIYVYNLMRARLLRPVVLVDYTREAYVHPVQNVRITFDKELSSGVFSKNLFSGHVATAPALEHGLMVLEIKFASYFPDFLRSLVQTDHFQRSAISKYVICRQFE